MRKTALIGAIIGVVNLLLSITLEILFFQNSFNTFSLFFLLIVFTFSGAVMGIVLNYLLNKVNYELLLTSVLLIGTFMGLMGVPPFGIWAIIGDVTLPMPTILIILPALPLFFILWLLNLLGLNVLAREHVWQWIVLLLLIIVYYYYISKIVVSFSEKDKEVK